MSLKELTKENHTNAERQEFVKVMFGGNIPNKLYAQYLYNQFPMYELLELLANRHGLFLDLDDLPRRSAILQDFNELWPDPETRPDTCSTVQKYLDHLMTIQNDPHKLMAHIYVRHMGDLSGGQMIAKRVPGEGRMYKFDNPEILKEKIRKKVDDSMADEAKLCFDFATQLFKEMMEFVDR
jgi:heme oxygenase